MGQDVDALAAQRWDDEYRSGRYVGEPPLPFVERILDAVRAQLGTAPGKGLYVGCGNGRNFIPLVSAGLDLYGLDVSAEALRQLGARRPDLRARLIHANLLDWQPSAPLALLIAIQVYQHGDDRDATTYFQRSAELLSPGGLFCLRVNSTTTEIVYRHRIIERNLYGGFTIEYLEGPKHGLPIHFYTLAELEMRTADHFEPVAPLREDATRRTPPQTGSWVQWEAIWRRQ
jgi:cyclopropane fatty-acyl-phospholipid synthase-like methyltransferase